MGRLGRNGVNDRTAAMVSLGVFAVFRALTAIILYHDMGRSLLRGIPALAITDVVFLWGVPFIFAYFVEGKDFRSLGLDPSNGKFRWFLLAGSVVLLLPLAIGRGDGALLELAEQVAYIGVAEEVFFRGYLMTRLCSWLGEHWGLMGNGLIFGVTHIVSLIAMGVRDPSRMAFIGLQTFLGGLLLGYLYLRSRSIIPSAVLHTFMNTYI